MPDSASCFDHIMELPNLGLCCLAENLDGGHEVRILDLVKHRKHVCAAVPKPRTLPRKRCFARSASFADVMAVTHAPGCYKLCATPAIRGYRRTAPRT